MNLLLRPVRTSVGSKYLMALTGLVLIGFVLGHMAGNLLIFRGREALNSYAHALETSPILLWTARSVLLAVFLLHITLGIRLTLYNRAARPAKYVCEDNLASSWASRHMLLTGLLVLAFVIYHLLHFTFGVTDPTHFKGKVPPYVLPDDPKSHYHDVAAMVVGGFEQWPVSLAYVVAMGILALHLWHGSWSWLQSLGWNRRGWQRTLQRLGEALALIVLVGNCSMPLAILAGWSPL